MQNNDNCVVMDACDRCKKVCSILSWLWSERAPYLLEFLEILGVEAWLKSVKEVRENLSKKAEQDHGMLIKNIPEYLELLI